MDTSGVQMQGWFDDIYDAVKNLFGRARKGVGWVKKVLPKIEAGMQLGEQVGDFLGGIGNAAGSAESKEMIVSRHRVLNELGLDDLSDLGDVLLRKKSAHESNLVQEPNLATWLRSIAATVEARAADSKIVARRSQRALFVPPPVHDDYIPRTRELQSPTPSTRSSASTVAVRSASQTRDGGDRRTQ